MTEKFRPCPDSEALGWWGDDRITVGYVSEVNGSDSAEMPDFVPTRHELFELAKYWEAVCLDLSYDLFLYDGGINSSDFNRTQFAARRINRIATVLGEEEVRKAIEEAEQEFSKTIDPRAWAIFKNGTPEKQEAFREEVLRDFSEDCKDAAGQAYPYTRSGVTLAVSRPLSDGPHEANAYEKCYEYAACTAGTEGRGASTANMQAEERMF